MLVLIAAAGSGRRMGSDRNKLLLALSGKPILAWTLEAILTCPEVTWIGVAGQIEDQLAIETIIALKAPNKPVAFIEGGKSRQESVSRSLAVLPSEAKDILIHDGARCLIEPALVSNCSKGVNGGSAVIAAIPVVDTIKVVSSSGLVLSTPNRSELWSAQTPQGFTIQKLRQAHAHAVSSGWDITDDASIYDRLGWPVHVIESVPTNIKITTQYDILIAEAILSQRKQ
ncbi:2-C-methyl-D-erythritol 4-phosphate cytidylyltransferase (chromatophore) [Paulinella micropora]|uniref:2-C-methyl-D-erythritol 4-phosphate cytidylyltransferase, chloroplastic n=1 Tax=Paulinella micropora TaxID=1928728 RepID=A0A1L5YCS0_9EUKA|nr:2-C-methyl-D-erythritol 4-phosphate cytidylyltransferase [Paulinella micropora]AQX45267.1 2-C-methyl-D-erythritol 4-phosphate cytidylyltransferase [Paulinella micropora]BBL86485.1 2-C-methyl-D-erythritol 4-phosphate cytidylyltransferase [Paulinella micropora]